AGMELRRIAPHRSPCLRAALLLTSPGIRHRGRARVPGITIVGSGRHVPGRPITNDELSKVMDTSDAWIRPRSGIEPRHYVAEGEGVSDLAVIAAQRALASSEIDRSEIDYVIFATITPEHAFPGSS